MRKLKVYLGTSGGRAREDERHAGTSFLGVIVGCLLLFIAGILMLT